MSVAGNPQNFAELMIGCMALRHHWLCEGRLVEVGEGALAEMECWEVTLAESMSWPDVWFSTSF